MDDGTLKCVFCQKSNDKLILFSEETLKKCKQVLKQRETHNLKLRNIKLPEDLYDSGYHRECYKILLLSQKYYSATPVKNRNLLNESENTSLASTSRQPSNSTVDNDPCAKSTSSQQNNSTARDSDVTSSLRPVSTNHEPSIIPEPSVEVSIELESVEAVSYITEESSVTLECDSNSFTPSKSSERDITSEKTQTCIYCEQKTKRHRLKRLPLHTCDKNLFLIKLNEEKEDMAELIEKVQDVMNPTIYYHKNCQLEYSYKVSSKKNTVKTSWHELRKHHQAAFDEVCNFIQQNVVEKGIEELETEATYYSMLKSTICPDAIKTSSNLCTGIAFDNYDRFVETNDGKDTLHDTVGIIYQNIDPNISQESDTPNLPSSSSEEPGTSGKRRRRTMEITELEERPYMKKPKMTDSLEISIHEAEEILPTNLQLYNNIDIIWMLSHAYHLPNLPMWVGYNSLISNNENNPMQIVSYLTPINLSPTNTSVVLETMEQSLKICEEVKQSSIQVTYDLAIAKVALQIQATEAPKFDKLFIHLGPFHIMMSYFKAVGKFITDCGLSNVMVQSSLLASGSVTGFLDGKHFNRCKRLHPLVSVGLEILHFKSFLDMNNVEISDAVIEELVRLQNTPISSFEIENEELKLLLHNYCIHKQQTLNGTGNNQRYINLTKVYEHLGPSLSRSLPGFHALTGCDFNPAFFKRGKKRPLNILMKKPEYQQAFMQFGGPESFTEELIQENIFNTIQKFICEIYNVSGVLDVDAARLQLFFNNYSVNNFNEAFNRKNLKNVDASNLPPCKTELFQQFLRANYISSVWNNANVKLPTIFTPEHNGWRFEENQYHFHWFDGEQLPGDISEFVKNSDEAASNGNITDDDEDDDSSGQYRNWQNDENSNDLVDEYDE
ncbi:hypothetical protein EVAR_44695_1 [Eumeta japonica]|uniref:Uncharacterized protein n=1 Tax=Eumeta variegata TaxID=151549 RepID=A0A4C1XIB9_EUMVA|nr:hypothetical protein EVAR_44695_1 [Eumeta japonica]